MIDLFPRFYKVTINSEYIFLNKQIKQGNNEQRMNKEYRDNENKMSDIMEIQYITFLKPGMIIFLCQRYYLLHIFIHAW